MGGSRAEERVRAAVGKDKDQLLRISKILRGSDRGGSATPDDAAQHREASTQIASTRSAVRLGN